MNLIYYNAPDSGLGDRLLDIILLYSYSKLLQCDKLYLHWSNAYWCRKCLLIDIFNKFIKLPDNIIFVDKYTLDNLSNDKNNIKYVSDMGAMSINYFINKNNITNTDNFKKIYFNSFNEIFFNNIPNDIVDLFNKIDIVTIHLRRSDKVNTSPGAHGVMNDEFKYLNDKTNKFIDECINNNLINICFISDDINIKNEYINKYKNKCNVISFEYDHNSQVYIDLFCLSKSKINFLSQKFSTFSIVGSLINKNCILYYPFNYGRMYNYDNIEYKFNEYPNFIYYE